MIFLYSFLIILAMKIITNTSKYYSTKRYLREYLEWIAGGGEDAALYQDKPAIAKLIKDAGIGEHTVSYAQPVGYNYIATGQASVLDNFPSLREDIAIPAMTMFHQAIGVYKSRIWETINPLYWLDVVIHLPRELFAYLGIGKTNLATKIFQLLWWIVAGASTLLYGIYKTETDGLIHNFLDKYFNSHPS